MNEEFLNIKPQIFDIFEQDIVKAKKEISSLRAELAQAKAEAAQLRAALEIARGQWIHGVNAEQCNRALSSSYGNEFLDAVLRAKKTLETIESDWHNEISPQEIYEIHSSMAREAIAALEKVGV